VVERDELEGMVAKPFRSTYKPGDRRAWLKVKNCRYWKYEIEREAVMRTRHGVLTTRGSRLRVSGW
jgi:ATP-dependent DNA ligase